MHACIECVHGAGSCKREKRDQVCNRRLTASAPSKAFPHIGVRHKAPKEKSVRKGGISTLRLWEVRRRAPVSYNSGALTPTRSLCLLSRWSHCFLASFGGGIISESFLTPGTCRDSHPSLSFASNAAFTALPDRSDVHDAARNNTSTITSGKPRRRFMWKTPDHKRLMQGNYAGVSLYIFLIKTTSIFLLRDEFAKKYSCVTWQPWLVHEINSRCD